VAIILRTGGSVQEQFSPSRANIMPSNIAWVGAAFCIGCCPNIRNGAAIAALADRVSPPML